MRRPFEACQSPKGFPRNSSQKKIFHIIPNLIISHRTFNNIKRMRLSMTTSSNKIKPFIRHLRKRFHFQLRIRCIVIYTNNMRSMFCQGPPSRLLFILSTIEPETEIFIVASNSYFRPSYYCIGTMVEHHNISPFFFLMIQCSQSYTSGAISPNKNPFET